VREALAARSAQRLLTRVSRRADPAGCRVLKSEAYRSMPWRNGRGSTLEIAREPAVGEDFAWRLSLAAIDEDGDFSVYRGYRRAIVLVGGRSLHLRFRRHGNRTLTPAKRAARFDGDWQTHCAVPEGSCTDLSLIVRSDSAARPAGIVRAPRVLRIGSARRVILSSDPYGAIFAVDGSVAIGASGAARPRRLRARDTLLLSPRSSRILMITNVGQAPATIVVLRWRPGGCA
jgi:environmental stress-induced protein Ves